MVGGVGDPGAFPGICSKVAIENQYLLQGSRTCGSCKGLPCRQESRSSGAPVSKA